MDKKMFKEFSKDVEDMTDAITLDEVIKTRRKGKAGLRDKLVFGKAAWQDSLGYFAILQAIVVFMALIPTALLNFNEFLLVIGIPFQFPVSISSLGAIIFIIFIFIFGIVGYRYWGLPRRAQEIGTKMSSGTILLWKQNKEILERIEKIEKKKK